MQIYPATLTTIALLCALPAYADVTARQVWDVLRDSMTTSQGAQITVGSVSDVAGGVDVESVVLNASSSDLAVTAQIPHIYLRENGDGTVGVTYAPTSRVRVKGTTGPGWEAAGTVTQRNVLYTASGMPDDVVFDMAGDSIAFDLTELTVPDASVEARGSIVLSSLTGQSRQGDQTSGTFSAKKMIVDMALTDTATAEAGTLKGSAEDLTFRSAFDAVIQGDLAESLRSGGGFSSAYGASNIAMTMTTASISGQPTSFGFTAEQISTDVALAADGLRYANAVENGQMRGLLPDLFPFPMQLQFDRLASSLNGPVLKDTPGAFGLGLSLAGVTTSDDVWNLFDPAQHLSRDPANLNVQLEGTGAWNIDVLSAQPAQNGTISVPGTLETLNVTNMTVEALGATLNGAGAFAFDQGDLLTIPGFPRPEGRIDVSLIGANAVIEALINVGLMTPENALGIRMMMAMFTQPGAINDSVTSAIEISGTQVSVNGQRIR